MPIEYKEIVCDNRHNKDFGKLIRVRKYYFEDDCRPLGVLYGCFSPFTGLNGHARLMQEARKSGIRQFVICFPNKKERLDDDRNMFTLQQKVDIAEAGCADLGIDVIEVGISKNNNFMATLTDLAERFQDRRIVLLCGPDRFNEYLKAGLTVYDDEKKDGQRYELFGVNSRGTMETSGTRVREAIRNGDANEFLRLTGYSKDMWKLCRNFAVSNGVVSSDLLEAFQATKRKGIYHLYSPGNSMELPAIKFLDLLKQLDDLGGKLVNGKNFVLQEKSDGAAFRMGIDEEGEFFIEQSYSGPIYDSGFLRAKYTQQSGRINRLGRGWSNIFETISSDARTKKCMRSIFSEVGPFKLIGEIFITELGKEDEEGNLTFVASRYSKTRIGRKATIVLFDAIGEDGQSLEQTGDIIDYMIGHATSMDIKYDDANLVSDQDIEIDIKDVLGRIGDELDDLQDEVGDIEGILSNTSRKREDQQVKKYVRTAIEAQQGLLNSCIQEQLRLYKGKWGPDYEGFVLKFKDGTVLKITSNKFKDFKSSHDDALQRWLKDEMD